MGRWKSGLMERFGNGRREYVEEVLWKVVGG